MAAQTHNLTGWRNTAFPPKVLRLNNRVDGVLTPINLSGYTFALDVRATPGAGSALISLDTAADDTANGVRVVEAAAGRVRLQIDQATMQAAWEAAYTAGLMKAGEAAPLFYDLLLIHSDGFVEAPLEGQFNIEPGITL
jgi:hypothetical protein